jgi:hypothetical protein
LVLASSFGAWATQLWKAIWLPATHGVMGKLRDIERADFGFLNTGGLAFKFFK